MKHTTNTNRCRQLGVWLCLTVAGFMAGNALAQTEATIKAQQLVIFAQFVTWPEQAFADANSPIVFGVLGDDAAFADALEKAVKKEDTIGNRKLQVKRSRKVEDLKAC